MEAKRSILNIRIAEETKRGIDKAAAQDRRTTASFVGNLLADYLAGKLKPRMEEPAE